MATPSLCNPGELHVLNQPLSDGEIGFLWRYLRRDAIDNRTFEAVRDHWGMCERHAFAMLAVAASIPRSGLHSVTALYAALMGQACAVAGSHGPLNELRCRQALRSAGRYRQAFLPDYVGTVANEDRGALIAAAGWCTGWNNLLRMNV